MNGGKIDNPVLFIRPQFDSVCTPERYEASVKENCTSLTLPEPIPCGHWVQQELPNETNALIVQWIATKLPGFWAQPRL